MQGNAVALVMTRIEAKSLVALLNYQSSATYTMKKASGKDPTVDRIGRHVLSVWTALEKEDLIVIGGYSG